MRHSVIPKNFETFFHFFSAGVRLCYISLLMRLFLNVTRVSSNSGGTKNLAYLNRLLLSHIEFGKPLVNLYKIQFLSRRQACRLQYRKRLRENQKMDTEAYTYNLHEALMKKITLISGSVGGVSLKLKVNVIRLTVSLTLTLLLTNLTTILKAYFPLMTLIRPSH